MTDATNISQDDAAIFQANQTPDGYSDAPDDEEDDPDDKARHDNHHPTSNPFDYPRPHEREPERVTRPVLHLPPDPKSLNGKQLTKTTLNRDRDMLETRKQRG